MRVLITNHTLAGRTGSELYVLEVARRLQQLGHEPMVYSPRCGPVAEVLRAEKIPAVSELSQLPFAPDVIHGQHHLETMTALLALPGVPAIFVCHGALPWEEMPPVFPRIHRYLAVDEACRERLLREAPTSPDKIKVLLNFVDLQRFQPRAALPEKPRRALVFSNYAKETNYLAAVRTACAQFNLTVDVRGMGVGVTTDEPENLLPHYDLVFAKARAALEAMAVGCAVIVCDRRGCGPLVTPENFAELRPWNFGFRTMVNRVTVKNLSAQIARYNAVAAAEVGRLARAEVSHVSVVDELVRAYEFARAAQKNNPPDPAAESRAAAAYLQWLLPVIKQAPKPAAVWSRSRVCGRLAKPVDKLARWLRSQ
jgi:glycosyltransferase involved in cell wall biosynthesis